MAKTTSSASACEPQIFTINNIQDAFDILSRGFEVYSQATNGTSSSAPGSSATRVDPTFVASATPRSPAPSTTSPSSPAQMKRPSYQPDLDIFDSPDAVLVEVSLPGVSKPDINIEYDSKTNRILLFGESKRSYLDAEGVKVVRNERPNGRFERVVGLGEQVVLPDQIGAEYKDGVLHLTIPKNKEAETKRKIVLS